MAERVGGGRYRPKKVQEAWDRGTRGRRFCPPPTVL